MEIRQPNASYDVLLRALRAAKGISSDHELSQVLQAVASVQPLTGDLKDAYLDAADALHGYEQGQVMTALVKSERGK